MLLVNFLNNQVDSKQLLKTIKKYDIKKLLIVNFKLDECFDLQFKDNSMHNELKIESSSDSKSLMFKILNSFKLEFEYIEISSNISTMSLIALLAMKIANFQTPAIIDLSNCPKTYVPYVVQTAYYIPNLINEIIMKTDETGSIYFSYPIVSINFDPDNETNLLKEILSLFLTKQTYYSDLAYNKTFSSNILLQFINDQQALNGCNEYKYPYIQACLSQLSQEQKSKTFYLQKRHNSSDKRALVYTITDHGVLTLLIWYLKQAILNKEEIPLYRKLHEYFNRISFSEIEYQ